MKNTATSSAHSAGPWTYEIFEHQGETDREYSFEIETGHTWLCTSRRFDPCDHAEYEANARLIVAARELLDYCKMLLGDCEKMSEDRANGDEWDWDLTAGNLRAVIAKVEGEKSRHFSE